MNSNLTVETEETFSSLLEFAANNDVEGFARSVRDDPCGNGIDEAGLWYGRHKGSKQMVLVERTPLMVASMYGSVDVVKTILSSSDADVNRPSGLDKSTALHCAASGGSIGAVEVVKLLLQAGADPNLVDANGLRPLDLITVSPNLYQLKFELEELLSVTNSNSPPLSSSPDNETPSSDSDSIPFNEVRVSSISEKKEYPIDPSIPDIKNSIYSTDEFRMFSFKIRPCSRAYSHDWTECPFVHPGENARRRDPRKYHYSCVPCPDFRKGACRRSDTCEYAHGVFECWLHPAQYRTRLCKDGTFCNRRVCFFAHTQDELRPLYVATGSAVPSPRSVSSVDFPMSPLSPSANSNVYLQSSRLRSSFNARDIPAEELSLMMDLHMQEQQKMLSELSRVRSARAKTLTPSNLEDLFSAENSSPRFSTDVMLSPINTGLDHRSSGRNMSPRTVEPISPMNSRVSLLSQRDKQFRSLSSRELGSSLSTSLAGSPGDSWSQWGSVSGRLDWAAESQVGIGRNRRSSSFEIGSNEDEPDLSWVQSLVKESSPQEPGERVVDQSVIGSWLEQMQLDHHHLGQHSKGREHF